jgi:hypothetical protein
MCGVAGWPRLLRRVRVFSELAIAPFAKAKAAL